MGTDKFYVEGPDSVVLSEGEGSKGTVKGPTSPSNFTLIH